MARPLKPIDPRQVELLAGCGCTVDEIGAKLGVSDVTLRKRFLPVIEKGRRQGMASLRSKQFQRAMGGSDTMLVWLGKQLLGQRDKSETGTPEEWARMTDDELRRIINDPAYEGDSLDAQAAGSGDRAGTETRATT